jgi:hypothetical protein
MKAIVVSDLHIGSRYFLRENFVQFLQNIPQDHEFILKTGRYWIALERCHSSKRSSGCGEIMITGISLII